MPPLSNAMLCVLGFTIEACDQGATYGACSRSVQNTIRALERRGYVENAEERGWVEHYRVTAAGHKLVEDLERRRYHESIFGTRTRPSLLAERAISG